MRLLCLTLSLLTGACASTPPPAAPGTSPMASTDTTNATPTAAVKLVGYPGGGAQMSVTFDADVPISPTEPALLVAGGTSHTAAIEAPPSVSRAGTVTTTATYRLDAAGRAAAEASGTAARLMLHDGTAYRTYPVSRPDVLN